MDRLISEQAVIDRLSHWYSDMLETGKEQEDLIDVIKAIPSAEPKMVEYTGDGYADGKMVYDMANCPNCNYEFEESDFIWGCKFCPECGQALKWEGEEE